MNSEQRRGQFRPPFHVEIVSQKEADVSTKLLDLREKNDAPISNYARIPLQSLPGLQPIPIQTEASLQSVPEQTKALTLVQSEQWRGPLLSFAPQPDTQLQPVLVTRFTGKRKILLLAIVLLLLVATGCFAWLSVENASPDVTLYRVSEQSVTQYSGGGGIVFPRQQFTLSYPEVEYAVNVLVKVGDQVSRDQPLLRLDPTRLNAQIKQASDDVAAAQAYLMNVSTSGIAATIAQAQQQYTIAKNKYNALIDESSSLLLHDGNLISPMKGVITTINVNPGEIFAPNAPLLVIMDETTVIVHVKVPLANLAQIHVGQKALVTPSALPNLNFQGTISSVIPQADPQTDTFEVWVDITDPHNVLLPGMSAFVRIQSEDHALVVPRLAVLNPSHGPVTFVVRDQNVYLQPVDIAALISDQILVQHGLHVGDRVVLVGQSILHDGERVHISSIEQ